MQDNKDIQKAVVAKLSEQTRAFSQVDQSKIMVVEDAELDRMICKRAITKAGSMLECDLYENATDALAELKDRETALPDLILLDVNMPDLNGLDFLDHVAAHPGLPGKASVLLMTSAPLPPMMRRRAARFRFCLGEVEKPVTAETVLSALRRKEELRHRRGSDSGGKN